MPRLTLPRLAFAAAIALLLATSCSKQGEGDPCDIRNNDDDCEVGLICVEARELLDDSADRCCPPADEVQRGQCRRRTGSTPGTGGSGGEGGDGGSAGLAGESGTPSGGVPASGGDGGSSGTCQYNRQCPDGLVCGPTGRCQAECIEDRDCPLGASCQDQRCVLDGG